MKSILKLLTLVLVLSMAPAGNSFSQVTQQWVRTNDGGNTQMPQDVINAMVIDGNSNVYVTGQSGNSGFDYDIVTIKYNSSGAQQWLMRYHNPGGNVTEAIAAAIALDSSGNVFVCGKTAIGGNASDIIVIKYNSSGVQQWVKIIDGGELDYATSIAADISGYSYVTGLLSSGPFVSDLYVTKYDPAGNTVWTRTFDLAAFGSVGTSLVLNNSGNIFVTGYSNTGMGVFDVVTIKYNSNGDSLWTRIFHNSQPPAFGDCYGTKLVVDANGDVFVGGNSGDSQTGVNYLTLKYNSSGAIQWNKYYHGPITSDDEITDIKADNLGNIYVTGKSFNSSSNADYVTIKYNSSGNQTWLNRYNGTGNNDDVPYSLALDNAGASYVTGIGNLSITGQDIVTIKYDSSGIQKWLASFNGVVGNGTDQGHSVAVDPAGNVFVAGSSQGGGVRSDDYTTIMYSQPIGIQQISNQVPGTFNLTQNYPNPFNPSTKINFALPKDAFAKIIIYDVLGREVTKLVNENLKRGTYEADWDAANFSSGIYFYRLESDGYAETKKMILMK
jgi:hypothetical protein